MPVTTRKRSTRQSRETRIKAILEAARQVFETRGYEKATVSEIAEQVGVVEGTVFSYFSSKRMLVLKVMEVFYDEITALLEEGVKGVEGTRNQLHYVIWNHLNIIAANRALCAVILRESRGLDKELSDRVYTLNRRYSNIVVHIIQQGIAAGEIKADTSPSLVRNSIFGTVEHYLWELLSGSTDIDLDKVADDLTNMVFNGISTKPHIDMDRREISRLVHKLNSLL